MTGDPDNRHLAAKACHRIMEVCRRDDDIRKGVVSAYATQGFESLYDMASKRPDDVIRLADELEELAQ